MNRGGVLLVRSCSLSDEWVPVPFANSSEICEAAHSAGYDAAFDLYRTCRADCREDKQGITVWHCLNG
eukprot:2807657-Amphidinium_carterae.1